MLNVKKMGWIGLFIGLFMQCLAQTGIITTKGVTIESASTDAKPIFRVIIAGDIRTNSIEGGVQQDLTNVHQWVKKVAKALDMELDYQQLVSPGISEKNIQAAISKSKKNDILIFYYSGHGRCQDVTNNYPVLTPVNKEINLSSIIAKIRETQPILSCIITDCCNSTSPKYTTTVHQKDMMTPLEKANIKSLFQCYSGEIIATASHANQEAYMSNKGSYFTNAFLKSFDEALFLASPNWAYIFSKAEKETYKNVLNDKLAKQIPYYPINIQGIDCSKTPR